jgi:hypothetical protein
MEYAIYFHWCTRVLPIFVTFLCAAFVAFPVDANNPSPEELLQMAEDVSEKTSQMAMKARETRDYSQAQDAFALANEAASWIFEVLGTAQQTFNPRLEQAAHDAANGIRMAIGLACDAAQDISASDPCPDIDQAVDISKETCDFLMQQLNLPPAECPCINDTF